MNDKEKYSDSLIELVVSRIDAQLPSDLKLFVGNGESFTKQEMIGHVRAKDAIGRSIVDEQMNFLRAVVEGTFIKTINTV
jgi:hypothetical protein